MSVAGLPPCTGWPAGRRCTPAARPALLDAHSVERRDRSTVGSTIPAFQRVIARQRAASRGAPAEPDRPPIGEPETGGLRKVRAGRGRGDQIRRFQTREGRHNVRALGRSPAERDSGGQRRFPYDASVPRRRELESEFFSRPRDCLCKLCWTTPPACGPRSFSHLDDLDEPLRLPLEPYGFDPPRAVGILSLILLALAAAANYAFHLAGAWRRIFVAAAVAALYLNVFVGVVCSRFP